MQKFVHEDEKVMRTIRRLNLAASLSKVSGEWLKGQIGDCGPVLSFDDIFDDAETDEEKDW